MKQCISNGHIKAFTMLLCLLSLGTFFPNTPTFLGGGGALMAHRELTTTLLLEVYKATCLWVEIGSFPKAVSVPGLYHDMVINDCPVVGEVSGMLPRSSFTYLMGSTQLWLSGR